jgi:hypothetical protein
MDDHLHEVRERRAGLRAAVGRVEGALATPARGRSDQWAKELAAELDELGDSLDLHVRVTEADDGLLRDIVTTAPHLSHRVERVRHDHVTLQHLLDDARASLPRDDEGVPAARDRVVALLTGIVRHRHLGSELVYDAYNVDLEAAD